MVYCQNFTFGNLAPEWYSKKPAKVAHRPHSGFADPACCKRWAISESHQTILNLPPNSINNKRVSAVILSSGVMFYEHQKPGANAVITKTRRVTAFFFAVSFQRFHRHGNLYQRNASPMRTQLHTHRFTVWIKAFRTSPSWPWRRNPVCG